MNRNWKVTVKELRNRKMRNSQGRRKKCGTRAQCRFKLWMKKHQTFRLNLGCRKQQGEEERRGGERRGVQWKAVCNYSGSGVDDDFYLLLGALENRWNTREEIKRLFKYSQPSIGCDYVSTHFTVCALRGSPAPSGGKWNVNILDLFVAQAVSRWHTSCSERRSAAVNQLTRHLTLCLNSTCVSYVGCYVV